MSQFSQSGIGAATEGAGAILGLERKMQEAAVRPRELEAAVSYKESQAAQAKAQILNMQELAGIESDAANKLKASGEAVNTLNGTKYLQQELLSKGRIEAAAKIQKQATEQELDVFSTQLKAAEVSTKRNEILSGVLDRIGTTGEYKQLTQTVIDDTMAKMKSGVGTEEDSLKLLKARGVLADTEQWERANPTGGDFSKFKASYITPVSESLKSASQRERDRAALITEEDRKTRLAETERHNREMEQIRLREAAASKDRNTDSKVIQHSLAITKLDKSYEESRSRLVKDLEKLELEVPAETPKEGTGFLGFFEDKEVNPMLVRKQAQLDRLEAIHKANLEGMQGAVDSGKIYVPKSYVPPSEKDIAVIGGMAYTRPAIFTDAQWTKYKEDNKAQ